MRKENEVIRLRNAVSGIPAGTVGTVMVVSADKPQISLVEFIDPEGSEIILVTVREEDIETPSAL